MEAQQITQVAELNGADSVNKYLDLGWVVLNTVAQKDGDAGWITYSLSWPKPLPADEPDFFSRAI